MKNAPPYAIASVDHALRLALLLWEEGPLRVADVAERLGVARSTAHRLLAMLVYRDFAERTVGHRYAAGSVLRSSQPPISSTAQLRALALPHLEALMVRTGETANLQILVGDQARFVATVECHQVLKVGNREGRMLPAHLVSAGKAILATMPERDVRVLYTEHADHSGPVDLLALLTELRHVRRVGYAINDQQTEAGVTAIARAVYRPGVVPPAAISLAVPSTRFAPTKIDTWLESLSAAATRIAKNLA